MFVKPKRERKKDRSRMRWNFGVGSWKTEAQELDG
jgi:hypothetical protein